MSKTEAYIMPYKQELMLSMSTCESTQNKDISGVSNRLLSDSPTLAARFLGHQCQADIRCAKYKEIKKKYFKIIKLHCCLWLFPGFLQCDMFYFMDHKWTPHIVKIFISIWRYWMHKYHNMGQSIKDGSFFVITHKWETEWCTGWKKQNTFISKRGPVAFIKPAD